MPAEPQTTALLLTVVGLLLALSAITSRVSRWGVPLVLVFLVLGMLAGSEGIGRIPFEDYHLSFRVGTVALALILFDGGLNTPRRLLREVAGPAVTLATLGVVGTAALVGVGARLLGFDWPEAFLLGAIVSSTDAAAVFSVLRGSGIRLKRRVGATLEAESGLNDPLAVILTLSLTEIALAGGFRVSSVLLAVWELAAGAALGWGIGRFGRWALVRFQPVAGGLHPILTLAVAFLSFGLATTAHASGFLAVYVTGVILADGPLPYRSAVLRVHDSLAWLGQIVMFLALGLLVFPSRLVAVAGSGLLLALLLTLVIRPLVVVPCLAAFRFPWREQLYVGWMGLRGAVPIILGTYPVLAGVPGAEKIFDLVFFVVVASVLVQGGAARWLTRVLGLAAPWQPPPAALIELSSRRPLQSELLSFFITPEAAVSDVALADVPWPLGAGPVLVIRGDELLAARDHVILEPGDHVYVFCRSEDIPTLQLVFGQTETS